MGVYGRDVMSISLLYPTYNQIQEQVVGAVFRHMAATLDVGVECGGGMVAMIDESRATCIDE